MNNVVSGGSSNQADAYHATISGGQMNIASASHTTVSGGRQNSASYFYATIGGGYGNTAIGRDSVIGGGSRNTASDARATVGGGVQNIASAPDTTIAGGAYNLASDDYASVGGGTRNLAEGFSSTIAGGIGNNTTADLATISGGLGNQALASYATISGGHGNIASGAYASIPGGLLNFARGDFSVASGRRSQTVEEHPGVFIFADSNDFDFVSETANEFAVRASGGVRFVTGIDQQGNPLTGVILPQGSGAWSSLSDRNLKENISPVDGELILASLAGIPISTWNYTGQESSIQHIGPMAQDFYASFGLGEDNKHISTIDADGISLAAIQGLYSIVQEQNAKINSLEAQIKITIAAFLSCVFMFIFLLLQNIKERISHRKTTGKVPLIEGDI
ncbi:MAG: tail fiber domain-containing protein [Chloroflexi bacterium]|nr:tail fiber domain-containing protein [Chloroflexota bacterium]